MLFATACSGGGGASGSGKVELSYRIWDKNQMPAMQQIVDKFETSHPGINVTIQLTPSAEFWTKMQANVTGGDAPDVFWINGAHAQFYAANGALLPLSDSVKQGRIDPANYPKSLVDLYSYQGTQYGVPKDFDTVGLWYNKKLFDAAGVKYPDDTWTWDTVKDAARKLTDASKGVHGIAAVAAGQENYYDTIFQAGGYVISPDGKSSGYDQPAAIAGLRFWTDLVKDGVSPSLQSMTDTAPSQMFESGKVAMYYGGSWNAIEFARNDYTKANADVAVLPAGMKRAVTLHGLANVVAAKTQHPEEATQFVEFLGSKEAADIQAGTGAVIPAFNGSQDAWVKSMPQFHLQAYLDELPYAMTYPTSKNTDAWQQQEPKVLAPAWTGDKDVATVAREMADLMNAALRKEG
ncbi:ABC transporter substrate-binding protein [Saccharopolyspora shandongensis]|uniref:ABC transporter substrate-binding protein n=1 Tax=Saccharopolyspora shandongensis TaxID=418495 RepID=UPI0033F8E173